MNSCEAKEAINISGKNLKCEERAVYHEIIDLLGKKNSKKGVTAFNAFEFSLIKKDSKMRFIHLNFWRQDLGVEDVGACLAKREKNFQKVFKRLCTYFGCNYDLDACQSLMQFNRQSGPWPIQIGFEQVRRERPKIKLYLSVNAKKFALKKFCEYFLLDYNALKKVFKKKRFDTVAFDFSYDGEWIVKFYPLSTRDKGILYRVSRYSKVLSAKKWKRFPGGLSLGDFQKIYFMKLPLVWKSFIHKNDLKIHYLCMEKEKESIYFR